MRYGLGYMGSKNAIADFIGANLPRTENFYDVFCGGCAVTHWAMVHNIAKNYYISDINFASELFVKAIRGEYRNETRWISREDFERLKNTDPYVRLCWSFGNNQRDYMYNTETEEWKRALWFAVVFRDYSLVDTYDGGLKYIIDAPTVKERKLNCNKNYGLLYRIIPSAVLLKDLPFKYTPKCKPYDTVAKRSDILNFLKIKSECNNESLQSLKSLQSLQSLERLERLQSLQSLQFKLCSYDDVDIKPNSVIYCDPPYKGTATYRLEGEELIFDHDRFYDWCLKQKELVIISEYDMPSDFECVAGREKYQQLAGTGRGQLKIECLFVPKHQVGLYRQRIGRLF